MAFRRFALVSPVFVLALGCGSSTDSSTGSGSASTSGSGSGSESDGASGDSDGGDGDSASGDASATASSETGTADGGTNDGGDGDGDGDSAEGGTNDGGGVPLNIDGLRNLDPPCVPLGESLSDYVDGGNGQPITCTLMSGGTGCEVGDGNGTIPEGVLFDTDTCSSSGAVTEDKTGTWVWIARAEQDGVRIHVPFCASKAGPAHEIALDYGMGPIGDAMAPITFDFTPGAAETPWVGPLARVEGGPICTGGGCTYHGYAFSVTCSPFADPYSLGTVSTLTDMGSNIGVQHGFEASIPTPSTAFDERPWVSTWTLDYCHAGMPGICSDPATNAQTHHVYSMLAWPEE